MRFFLRRLLFTLPVFLGAFTLTFALVHFVPGDPVDLILGDQAAAIDREALRKELGLHVPLMDQYVGFLLGVFKGDLGKSLMSRRPVVELIKERFPATLELTSAAMLLALLIGLPLGVLSAVRHNTWVDGCTLFGGLLGMSVPGVFLGPLLIYIFAIWLGVLPVSERGSIDHLILPATSLALPLGAIIMRMTRGSMLEVLKEDYVRVARAKGAGALRVYFRHCLANALMPIITVVGLQVGALLTGTVITETIFDWPGVGTLLLDGIQQRDYPIVQGCVLFIASIYVLTNLATDLAYGFANPKVRVG